MLRICYKTVPEACFSIVAFAFVRGWSDFEQRDFIFESRDYGLIKGFPMAMSCFLPRMLISIPLPAGKSL